MLQKYDSGSSEEDEWQKDHLKFNGIAQKEQERVTDSDIWGT